MRNFSTEEKNNHSRFQVNSQMAGKRSPRNHGEYLKHIPLVPQNITNNSDMQNKYMTLLCKQFTPFMSDQKVILLFLCIINHLNYL